MLKRLSVLLIIILISSCSSEDVKDENLDNGLNKLTNLSPTLSNITLSEAVLIKINEYRASKELNTIVFDINNATKLALEHSTYMVNKNQPSHDNFYYRFNELNGYGAISVSENVSYGYNNAESIVNAWLNSPSHKEVLDGDFNFVGIGVLSATDNTNYCTALFYKK